VRPQLELSQLTVVKSADTCAPSLALRRFSKKNVSWDTSSAPVVCTIRLRRLAACSLLLSISNFTFRCARIRVRRSFSACTATSASESTVPSCDRESGSFSRM
jgi:hypothetical protein